ncbi:MAG: SDR family NAD(P)-dependent oxidoreductase [Propionibacteriaceae bacterium]|jgi:short-subunit dehydrogenase|nr:SDR family NAD(P)-dependent oxidoreductase [Propionibacteriaceae bacterium]
MPTALITGGTVGIGHAFAKALAERGYDLVLASRDEAGLQHVAAALRTTYGIEVEIIPTDLAVRADVLALAARLEDPERPIDLLVNNAGFAVHQSLLVKDFSVHERAIDVMCLALLILGGAAARAMKARGEGAILNVTSSSAVITTGNYSAVKAWATVYTEALANELRGTGVRVMGLMPGWVKTEFHTRGGVKAHNLPDFVWIDVDQLVAGALRDLARGKVLSVPTRRWAFAVTVGHIMPRVTSRWLSRALTKSRDE